MFTLFRPAAPQLWETDGTPDGTHRLELLSTEGPVAVEWLVAEINGVRFFSGDGGLSLWRTDGSAAGTRRIYSLANGERYGLWAFAERDGTLYFMTRVLEGDLLWSTDGTPEGTVQVGQVQASIRLPTSTRWPEPASSPVRYRGHLVFVADDGAHGRELWQLPLAAVTCPASITTEATSAAGAPVTYPAARLATDVQPGTALSYSAVPGTTFALGSTPVTVDAAGSGYPLPSCTFTVTVRDTTAPQLQCPEDVSAQEEAQGRGVSVSYTATAADAVTASPAITYSHEPGSVFRGNTQVKVTATDTAGNTTSCTFAVKVGTPKPRTGCSTAEAEGSRSWAWLGVLALWVGWARRRAGLAGNSATC